MKSASRNADVGWMVSLSVGLCHCVFFKLLELRNVMGRFEEGHTSIMEVQ